MENRSKIPDFKLFYALKILGKSKEEKAKFVNSLNIETYGK